MESPELPKADLASDLAIPSTPRRSVSATNGEPVRAPTTPMRSASARVTIKEPTMTPRVKKKVPWKGKNIMVLLPRDDERGRPGHAPKPLNQSETERMFASWEELGYDISGFDLDAAEGTCQEPNGYSQSRDGWPTAEDIIRERAQRAYKVTLPDLNAWKNYVNELNEAKLRALGVSFGDDDPPAPSISPAVSQPSRQASAQYPPLPFSPPLPTSSASSNHVPGFPFPSQFMPGHRSSATQSPGIASPVGFGSHPAKYNARQSISVPMGHSPFQLSNQPSPLGWPSQHRTDSPSLFNGVLSPVSPFTPEGFAASGSPAFNAHQRHQSLQYPMMPHQFMQQPARASPRLQEVREDEEEPVEEPPAKPSEPAQRNSDDLQAEIDEAEYHLEEQMRNELEHEDYSPHNEEAAAEQLGQFVDMSQQQPPLSHARDPSVQFQEFQPQQFAKHDGPVLHHPRPHSRGHSLSQNFFSHHDENRPREDSFSGWHDVNSQRIDEAAEIETNPSNLGTPVQDYNLATLLQQHQRSFSTASNPWNDAVSSNDNSARRGSHASKPSFSKLNVKAPEFKFNPGHNSNSNFSFGGSSGFQPTVFQAGSFAPSITSPSANSFGAQSTSSKINAAAPVFSPGQSDFSFSASGPKFRPDAPTFTPFGAVSDSLASPTSGSESLGNRSSIFGNIDLGLTDVVKPPKKSKAIPILPPSDTEKSADDGVRDDADGRLIDESRLKRVKASRGDGDDVPMFAEPSPEPTSLQSLQPASTKEELDVKSGDDQAPTPADTTMSSAGASEQPTDSKAVTATSPSDTSPDQQHSNWAPFELETKDELQTFHEAHTFGIDSYKKGHNKSLSATAKAFVPGGGWGAPAQETETEEEDEDERDREDTIEPIIQTTEAAPSPPRAPSPSVPQKFTAPKGLGASRFASPPKPKGLAASRFAASPSPAREPEHGESEEIPEDYVVSEAEEYIDEPHDTSSLTVGEQQATRAGDQHEPTFEEIDAIMDHLNQNDPTFGVNRSNGDIPRWPQTSPNKNIQVTHTSPYRLQPAAQYRSRTSSPVRQYHGLPGDASSALPSTELEDPFVDPPLSAQSFDAPITNLNIGSAEPSDWEGAFSDEEQAKLEQRVQFFDGRVNAAVSDLLASRLAPMEKALLSIQQSLRGGSRRASSSVRRSVSAEIQHSDADDEDEEPAPRRSMSPRRDRRMEQIRAAVLDAFAVQQRNLPPVRSLSPSPATAAVPTSDETSAAVLRALEEMREQFGTSMRLDFRGEDLRNIVEEAVEKRMPTPSQQPAADRDHDEAINNKLSELQAKVIDLEERLYVEQAKVEKEVTERRGAEDLAAELERKLQAAETRVEVEIMNKSIYDDRVNDLDERLKSQEQRAQQELDGRRTAEDRLSEVQRLLRISSEEENRLREVVEERDHKIKALEQSASKQMMTMALMEASQTNATQAQTELTNRINQMEDELRASRQEANHWRSEAERAVETARRQQVDLNETVTENKQLQKFLDTLGTQLQENERVRESWRAKFGSLQEDMAQAARDITEENARRTKREQALVARQEVLDAKLQAEARTRERLETEIERLENGERQGMRAVNECKRLEGLLGEMKTENHKLHQSALRYQREFEEARESGASEVQRTRLSMQHLIDEANHQVNVVREELEEQIAKLRADNDQLNMDKETSKAQSEMMAEDAQTKKVEAIEELKRKHQNELEELQYRHERQLNNAVEDGQKTEQHLLERLSLSTSKTEHLQDRVAHLEEKLEIAIEAARAAAQAAKSAGVETVQPIAATFAAAPKPAPAPKSMELPEKISPQALRESIMVLQEQLQAREQRIEELESTVDKLDPEAPTKIAKRDDEITWLRELLAVRHGDLQDIILAVSAQDFDREAVKDAAIRLKANLQMEEQERERAMNGGSAINLPNIAQSIMGTPRVAQAVGPLAAAWGNWRKSQQASGGPRPSSSRSAFNSNHTPSRSTVSNSSNNNNNLLGGLLTPPASGLRQTPPAHAEEPQPTAFQTTGRRYTAQQLQARARGPSVTAGPSGSMPLKSPPLRRPSSRSQQPVTPPMMRSSAYDSDAHPGDFDDQDFFED